MTTSKARRAAIYARISRDIEGEGLGVARQREDCEALAAQLGMVVVEAFEDNDLSAYSRKPRPAYERMLQAIEQGRIDAVLVLRTDRLYRRMTELERFIDTCNPRSIPTYSVRSGHLDLTTANGRMVARLLAATAQGESEVKSERIARQKAQAAKAGKFLGGRIPWGWRRGDGGQIEVDPTAAELIRQGTEAIIAGRSLISVTRAWAAAGAANGGGKPRNTTEVRRTLLRPRNAGLTELHGEVVDDSWPAIVPLERFRMMEAILTDPSRPRQTESKYRYLLSGIATCHCGMAISGFGVEGRRSYRCTVHQAGGRYVRGHVSRRMGPLDDYVRGVTAEYLRREDVRAALLDRMRSLEAESRPLQSQDVSELLNRKATLARLFAQGAITESQLVEGSREVEGKLGLLEAAAAARGGSRALNSMVISEDPGAAFLDAEVDIQREVIRALFEVRLNPTGPHRGEFDPESVTISPKDSQ